MYALALVFASMYRYFTKCDTVQCTFQHVENDMNRILVELLLKKHYILKVQ